MADGSRPSPALAALSALTGRRWKLGPARNKVGVERDVAVRMRDGAVLRPDHYAPVTSGPRPSAITMPVLAPGGEAGDGGTGDGTRTRETSL